MEFPYSRERAIANATRENTTVGFHELDHYGTAYSCGCIYYHPVVNQEINFAIQCHEPCEKHRRH